MTLVLTLLVRDEADVVAAMIEHHLAAGVDFVVATDNGSTDGTAEILGAYERAGVLRLIHEPAHTYEQAKWVTRMARLAATDHGADWVINADADEFWWARDGDNLATTLAMLPAAYGTVEAPRENLVGDPGQGGDWPARLVLRDLLSLHQRGGRIGPKVCHRADPTVEIAQGNHSVKGARTGRRWPASPITVLHAPDRSFAQFAHKIAIGGASLVANPELDPEFGWHWRADYARLLDGTLFDEWQARQPGPDTVAADLAAGRLVRDERLRDRLDDLRGRAVLPDQLAVALSGVML